MRYTPDHKEATHRRIVETASERFRKEGLEAVGVASLMADAGLTHGGFYSHFPSKEALVGEALVAAMEGTFTRLSQAGETGGIEGLIEYYLRPAHRDRPERGCVAAALAGEIARQPSKIRTAFNRGYERVTALIAGLLPDHDPIKARALFPMLIGCLQTARAISDPKISDQILQSGREAALLMVKAKPGPR